MHALFTLPTSVMEIKNGEAYFPPSVFFFLFCMQLLERRELTVKKKINKKRIEYGRSPQETLSKEAFRNLRVAVTTSPRVVGALNRSISSFLFLFGGVVYLCSRKVHLAQDNIRIRPSLKRFEWMSFFRERETDRENETIKASLKKQREFLTGCFRPKQTWAFCSRLQKQPVPHPFRNLRDDSKKKKKD